MDAPPLSDDESLVRAFFCPEQHNGTEFLPNAVSLDDLKDRGFSVDRPPYTPVSVLAHRLTNQKAKKPTEREFPKFSELFYRKLMDDKDGKGNSFFDVQISPVAKTEQEPANPGHASVFSADKSLGRGELRKVRSALIDHLNNVVDIRSLAYINDCDIQEIVARADAADIPDGPKA